MQYPFYILRKVVRAISWFFEPESERIYCKSSSELRDNLKEGDEIYVLNKAGKYVKYYWNETDLNVLEMMSEVERQYYAASNPDFMQDWNEEEYLKAMYE